MNKIKSDKPEIIQSLLSARKVMFLGAHPDDIEFYCAGLVHYLREANVEVTFLIATKGDRAWKGRAGEALRLRRQKDQLAAARILGDAEVNFLDYPDKFLDRFGTALAADLKVKIAALDPDFVFCWDSEHIYNPHPDHVAAADAFASATKEDSARVIYYGTRLPDFRIALSTEAYTAKIKSLRAHTTETPWYYWLLLGRRLRRILERDGAPIQARYAEVFRLKP